MKFSNMAASIASGWILALFMVTAASADPGYPHPETYLPSPAEVEKAKTLLNDPRTLVGGKYDPRSLLPPELKDKFFFDAEKMKELWAEVVGFRSPDVVGQIAPEIKPGKYAYKDLDKYPGLKELMAPYFYELIKPGEPPFAGNMPEFEIVPPRQLYWALPVAQATKQNKGKTKLDDAGYILEDTWEAGYPFPQPSGEFKAQQYVYNHEKRYEFDGGNFCMYLQSVGVDRRLRIDQDQKGTVRSMRLKGRCFVEPYGWLDAQAEDRGEYMINIAFVLEPRDLYGAIMAQTFMAPADKQHQNLMYIPGFRRFRKLSATDSQDPVFGSDQIVDDTGFFMQKLSPDRYPYKYRIVEDREFLMPTLYDGTEYADRENNFEFRGIRMERRPIVVIELIQQDRSYVYGKRLFYVDKETFQLRFVMNYDQKGRLYRTNSALFYFEPQFAQPIGWFGFCLYRDHIDLHSGIVLSYVIPAIYSRKDMGMGAMAAMAK